MHRNIHPDRRLKHSNILFKEKTSVPKGTISYNLMYGIKSNSSSANNIITLHYFLQSNYRNSDCRVYKIAFHTPAILSSIINSFLSFHLFPCSERVFLPPSPPPFFSSFALKYGSNKFNVTMVLCCLYGSIWTVPRQLATFIWCRGKGKTMPSVDYIHR